jgi:ubiquinone/menaquinone biosynthesis C-methylase UbiE
VRSAAEGWDKSPYYQNAEQLLYVFWDEETLFRKVFEQLDLTRVLDLACGHGRHTERIVGRAGHVTLMDVHETNIEACRRRLGHHRHLRFVVNNGYDFRPLDDGELTAIFCYDAMVHFAPLVVAAYLSDTRRVLGRGGLALYHHSNYPAAPSSNYALNPGARNHMTQELFGLFATAAGLTVVESHVLPWGGVDALDCVTLVRKP